MTHRAGTVYRRVQLMPVCVAALAVASAAATVACRASAPARALRDLAEAYASSRPMEMRIPSAGFAPLRATRGATGAEIGRSYRFLEIRANISRHLAAEPEDAAWLHAQGRSELLMGSPRDAIHTLHAAAELGEDNADLWNDLGAAYYDLSMRDSSADEDTLAVEALGRAAGMRPKDAAIRFNLGVALARLQIFDAAAENLDASLAAETGPAWIEETKSRLKQVKDQRARLFSLPSGLEIPGSLDERMEKAFTGGIAEAWAGGRETDRGLRQTARDLLHAHGDRWLTDVTALTGSARNPRVAEALSKMARVRSVGRFDQYGALEDEMAWLRRTALPPPLALWRDFEFLFRSSHARNLGKCPASGELLNAVRRRGYRALEIQTMLENSTCENGIGRLDAAFAAAEGAVRLAAQYAYASLGLRARGFLVSDYVNQGRYREAYQVSSDSIAEIIQNGMPIRRAHQLYHTIERGAERLEHWYTARAAVQMAREVAGAFGSSVYEMIAQCKRADYSARLGLWREADVEYKEALKLYGRLPATADVEAYGAAAQAGLLESRKDYAGLLRLRRTVEDRENAFLQAPVDVALARVALALNHPREASERAGRLAGWLDQQSAPAEAERIAFRKMLERASVTETKALLAMNQPEAAYDAWQRFLRREARLLGSTAPVQEISPDAGDGAAAMTIADLETRAGMWLKSGNRTRFEWAAEDRSATLRDVRRLRRLCADPQSPRKLIRDAEASVWRELFEPVLARERDVKKLRVQAEGEFSSIPLSLLVADYENNGMPGDSAFTPYPVAARASAGRRSLLVDASHTDPALDGGLPPLPGTQIEIARIAASVPDPEVLAGAAATPSAIERAAAAARLVHFSGHAIYWRGGPALAAAPDAGGSRAEDRTGILRLTPERPLAAELVSLAACSTAYGEDNETLAPSQLAEAALLAGARNAVGSLWDVDSAATAEFDVEFYRWWGKGHGATESLRRAALEARGNPAYAHPYYWAGFVLYQSEK